MAAPGGGLWRQIGVNINGKNRVGVAEMRQGNPDGVVNLRCARERRIEVLSVELTNELEGNLAWNLPVKFSTGELT